jgi:hypothetical protein
MAHQAWKLIFSLNHILLIITGNLLRHSLSKCWINTLNIVRVRPSTANGMYAGRMCPMLRGDGHIDTGCLETV